MLRLKANKTSLYNLVATYKPLPGMRRVDFQKANGRPDYWLEWTTDDGHTKAFLSSSLGHPILTITTHDAAGGRAGSCTMRRTAFPLRACGSAAWWRKSPPPWRGGGRHMAERNDMTAALVTAYTSPQLAAINEYLEAEKAVRAAAEILGLDADLMIAEAEGLARATTFSNVEALYFVADQAASGKREVNGHA